MSIRRWPLLAIVGLSLAWLGCVIWPTGPAQAAAFDVLKLSPVRTDITIAPGESKSIVMTLTNPSPSSVTLQAVENDFVSNDEQGTPDLILDPNITAPTHSLKAFMAPIDKVTVAPGESKQVTITIRVPADAQAGGYFGAVRFIADRAGSSGQVNMNASLASLILLRVPGDIVEKLQLTTLTAHLAGQTMSSLFYGGQTPLALTVRFENKGNVQVSPVGMVSVKRGKTVVYEGQFNDKTPRDMILPDGARKWQVPLKNTTQFGKYTVYATFSYGQANTTITTQTSFWVIPTSWWLWAATVAAVIIGLLVVVSIGLRIYRRPRKMRLGGRKRR